MFHQSVIFCVVALCFVNTLALPKAQLKSKGEWKHTDTDDNEIANFREDNLEFDPLNLVYGGGVHNLTVGTKTYRDRVLYQTRVYKPLKRNKTVEVFIIIKSNYGKRIISYVEAYDIHNISHYAGYATIIKGGPGKRFVTIYLKSIKSQNIQYFIRIWGH